MLEAAQRLLASGDARGAIDYCVASIRSDRSAAKETDLVKLRLEAASNIRSAARPTEPWPPHFDDPFPGLRHGLPEVNPEDLTAALVAGAIEHHGALLVRQLVSAASVAELQTDLASAFAGRARFEGGLPQPDDDPATYRRLDGYPGLHDGIRTYHRNSGALWVAESPKLMFDLLDAYERVGLLGSLRDLFGEPLLLSVNKTVLRSTQERSASGHNPAWHQDGAFMGADVRSVNAWLALTHCGGSTNSPGMELVPNQVGHVIGLDGVGRGGRNGLSHEQVLEVCGQGPPISPEFHPGDGLLFDGRFLHRTAPTNETSLHRDAIEAWFFAASTLPPTYVPVAV